MRRMFPGRLPAPAALLLAALALASAGADANKKKSDNPPLKLKGEETVADLADILSNGEIEVEGVGLVVNLDNTGSDPEPSPYRAKLLDEMRKASVPDADKWLASKRTSLVIVRGKIPTGITPKDRFDIEVALTPASTTTSLAGGFLLETRLHVRGVTKDGVMEGRLLGKAAGPVLAGSADAPNNLKAGRILGGARVIKELPFGILIKDSRRSAAAAKLIENAVNLRFQTHEGIEQKGCANAQNDQLIHLKVTPVYHQNQGRYFEVVGLLPILDNPGLRASRLEKWSKELLSPATSAQSALKLEGLGRNATEALKAGLAAPDPAVRFYAAEALAYLNDDSGSAELTRAAVENPKFRALALAALAASDQVASRTALRALLARPEVDLRYGAFNALRAMDPNDPFLGRVPLLRSEPEPDAEDLMAMGLDAPRRRARRPEDPFDLYVVRCEGPPLVHIARSRRCEVVLFGESLPLQTPVVLGNGGSLLLNAADGDTLVQISRIATGRPDQPDKRVSCPLELGEVIRELANLDASYPDVLVILQDAQARLNLPAPLVVDAMPKVPTAAEIAAAERAAKKDAAVGRAGFEADKPAPRRGVLQRIFPRGRR